METAAENFSKRLRLKIFSALLKQEIAFYYKRDFDQLKVLLEHGASRRAHTRARARARARTH